MGAPLIGVAGAVATAMAFAPAAAAAEAQQDGGAADPVTIVGGADARTVPLIRQKDKALTGSLVLLVRNNSNKTARLRLRFFPADGSKPVRLPGTSDAAVRLHAPDGELATSAPQVRTGRLGEVVLHFELPSDASPSNADGDLLVALKLSAANGKPTVVSITGTGERFAGVAFRPAKVTLRSTSNWPLNDAPDPSERVQLVGPGVPALFEDGVGIPAPRVLVLDDGGHSVRVSLRGLRRDSALAASAEVKASGDLEPGRYDTKLPLSALSSAAPQLSVAVEANDLFVWPVVFVLLGALAALVTFLATGLNRRKALLRIQLRALLERYRKERDGLGAGDFEQPAVIWALEDLGDPAHWYERKWDALPELDGARGIWSTISYARSEADLDDDEERVLEVQQRVTWWLKTLRHGKELAELDQLGQRHLAYGGHNWSSTNTSNDAQVLLGHAEDEPIDDAAAEKLIDRLRRHARWHRAFGEVWDLWAQLGMHMDAHQSAYTDAQREEFRELALDVLDSQAVEATRTPESQRDCEHKLEQRQGVILQLMEHGDVPPPDDAPLRSELDEVSPDDAYRELVRPAPAPVVARDEDKPTRRQAYDGVIRSDFAWTIAIALLTAIVYMVPLYDSTWGSVTDYATAFAAGFLGKIGIQWAAMPLFQSLRLRFKAAKGDGGESSVPQPAKAAGAARP